MSVFNYKTKRDPIGSLQAEIAKLKKLLKALIFWEVNDTQLGNKTLKRRKVSPNPNLGVVARGSWFEVNGLSKSGIGSNTFPWDQCSLGYKVNPDGDNKAEVRIHIGEIGKNATTQTDLEIKGTVETSVTKYVYARVTIATPTTILITQANSVPADDATYTYYRLYRFTSNLYPGSSPARYIIDDDLTQIYRPFDIMEKATSVTKIVAGTLITISPTGGTGAVTINGTAELPAPGTDGQLLQSNGSAWVTGWGRMKTI